MKDSKSLIMTVLLVALGLMLISGCNLFGGEQSSPERTVKAYFEAGENHDSEKMASLHLHGREIKPEALLLYLDLIDTVDKDFEIDINIDGKQMIHDNKADVYVKITIIVDGEKKTIPFLVMLRLEKIDGKWFLDL